MTITNMLQKYSPQFTMGSTGVDNVVIDSNGLQLNGNTRKLKAISYPAGALSGTGSINTFNTVVAAYQLASLQFCTFLFAIPTDIDLAQTFQIYVNYYPDSAAGGQLNWDFSYLIVDVGTTLVNAAPTTLSTVDTVAATQYLSRSNVNNISTVGINKTDLMHCRMLRQSGGTYSGNIFVESVELRYTTNSLGL